MLPDQLTRVKLSVPLQVPFSDLDYDPSRNGEADMMDSCRRKIAEDYVIPVAELLDVILDDLSNPGYSFPLGRIAAHDAGCAAEKDVFIKTADPAGFQHGAVYFEDLPH